MLLVVRVQQHADFETRVQQAINAAVKDMITTIRTDTRQLVVMFPEYQQQLTRFEKLLRAIYGSPEERAV